MKQHFFQYQDHPKTKKNVQDRGDFEPAKA